MSEKKFAAELELLIRSRYPVIWIETWEEERARDVIERVGVELGKKVFHFDCLSDISDGKESIKDTATPERALEHIRTSSERAIYVLYDLHPYLQPEQPAVVRRLRQAAFDLKRSYKTMIIVSPVARIPPELEKQITLLDLPLPDREELLTLLRGVLKSLEKRPELKVEVDNALAERIVKAAGGLTVAEAERLFLKAAVSDRRFGPEDLSLILEEKKQVLRKTGLLEYFDADETLADVGGLGRLKEWLSGRSNAFSEEARRFGLPEPKGLLLLGVQGCGKSLTAKAVAKLWQLPLLRLDVGSLFSMYIGSTEANMRKAIKIAETLSPVVLWLDEIEKGLSGLESSGAVDAGVTARIFSSFLLWMQEKKHPVFVVATSNDVRRLPPELLRKGRFDEIFFIDLPSERERDDIFRIHLRKRRRDPGALDVPALAVASEGFSGAEIENAVISGLYKAFAAGRDLTMEDLLQAVAETIPLSKTMAERIDELRSWAATRARPAS
jgi:SpoVK/Ycf46/Vps4 family AAA+-type ATPase